MGILAIDDWKLLKKAGEKLGRKEIAERVLECVDAMLKDSHYQGVIEFAGRMKAITQACSFDIYWDEKAQIGFRKELGNLQDIANGHEHRYYGYCGKNILEDQPMTNQDEQYVSFRVPKLKYPSIVHGTNLGKNSLGYNYKEFIKQEEEYIKQREQEAIKDELKKLLESHHSKAYITCEETCMCWDIEARIAQLEEGE